VLNGPGSGNAPSPSGWLNAGNQNTIHISGNNVNAYLDRDNNNGPDSGGSTVSDGNFLTSVNLGAGPTTAGNQAVAVQNLFYVNNVIHDKLYQHGTFFSRLHHFVHLSSAFVVMPGGIGTTLEAMLVWQLAQVGHLEHRPLIFVGDMWRELVEWGRESWVEGERQLAASGDVEIPVCVDTVDEAVEVIERNLAWWEAQGEPAERVERPAG